MTGPSFNLPIPRFADYARRVLGEELEVNSVSPELALALVLEMDRLENLFPLNVVAWWGQWLSAGPSVGNFATVGVRNPTGSGLICTVLGGFVKQNDANGSFGFLGRPLRAGVTIAQVLVRDQRWSFQVGAIQAVTKLAATQNDGGTGPVYELATNGNGAYPDVTIPPFVLAPGTELFFATDAANVGIRGSFYGYYRSGRAEELG